MNDDSYYVVTKEVKKSLVVRLENATKVNETLFRWTWMRWKFGLNFLLQFGDGSGLWDTRELNTSSKLF